MQLCQNSRAAAAQSKICNALFSIKKLLDCGNKSKNASNMKIYNNSLKTSSSLPSTFFCAVAFASIIVLLAWGSLVSWHVHKSSFFVHFLLFSTRKVSEESGDKKKRFKAVIAYDHKSLHMLLPKYSTAHNAPTTTT